MTPTGVAKEFGFATSYKGVVLLKTTEKTVIVEFRDNGKLKRHTWPIATANGDLMLNRLSRLLDGKIGHGINDFYGEWHDIEYVGMIWPRPCRLLEEIRQSRLKLERELAELLDKDEYFSESVWTPPNALDDQISDAIKREISLRKKAKAQIRAIREEIDLGAQYHEPGGGWTWISL